MSSGQLVSQLQQLAGGHHEEGLAAASNRSSQQQQDATARASSSKTQPLELLRTRQRQQRLHNPGIARPS
ncbi:hypothetical protein D9Q98_010568 [Chlorella vulgaris]|uniref:Uncharacterized protein n=1 Tax=Chlorella vulgaris TaxID=3077 RepID=A0A9D4TQS3_CHLVU|nr:hypothetical protein D9Q98_010568 [Chlorella vulgaris]